MKNLNFLPKHKEVLLDPNNRIFVHGGYGGGKSYLLLFKMIQNCRFMPGSKWICGRYTYAALNKDTYEILFNTQDGLLNGLGTFTKKPDVFEFPNGSKIFFTHFDDPRDIVGGSVSGYLIEQAEQIKEEVFDALKSRVSRYWGRKDTKGSPYNQYMEKYKDDPMVIKPPRSFHYIIANPDSTSFLKKKFISNPEKFAMGWSIYKINMHDNEANLEEDYIEKQIAEHSELYVQRNVYGSWEGAEGLVYDEFCSDNIINPIFDIHPSEKIFVGIDPGYGHYSAAAFCVMRDQKLIVFDEVYERGMTASEVAKIINEKLADRFRDNLPKYDITFMMDPSANRIEMGTGKSIKSYYVDANINPINADNEAQAARFMIKDLLKTRKLMVTSNCIGVIGEFGKHSWKPKLVNGKQEVIKLDDDLLDCIRYVCNYQPDFKKQIIKTPLGNSEEDNKKRTLQYLTHLFNEEGNDEEEETQTSWGL